MAADNAMPALEKGLTPEQNVNYAIELLNLSKYDQCLTLCNEVLKADPNNAKALFVLSAAYTAENQWDEGILYGEKAIAAGPGFMEAYGYLYMAYAGKEDWTNALRITEKIIELNHDNKYTLSNLTSIKRTLQTTFYSNILVGVFFILVCIFFLFFYGNKSSVKQAAPAGSAPGIVEIFFISASVCYIFYLLFFLFAPLIRSTNLKIPPDQITGFNLAYSFQRDGIEGYVLYAGVTAIVLLTMLLVRLPGATGSKLNYYILFIPAALLTCLYIKTIGFYPPCSEISEQFSGSFPSIISTSVITVALYYLNRYSWKIAAVVIGIALVPVCFIATAPVSTQDYSYILAPSLRLAHGFKISEIYFQYDLLLSLIGWGCLKSGMGITLFQMLCQLSFYVFLLGLFLFTRKLFVNKALPVLLFIFLVIVRCYANMYDPTTLAQVTPLRLDLWFILLALVYWKGPYHWIVGLAVGLLALFHKNLGLLYLAAYLQLLFFLFALELTGENENNSAKRIIRILKRHLALSGINILLIAAAIVTSLILFKGFIPVSLRLYVKMGIGMLPVSKTSFYFYVPVVLGMLAVLLLKAKSALPEKYFVTGSFLILLTIANSMYFFGRSHENNILNISGALALSLFMLFDLIIWRTTLVPENKPKEDIAIAAGKKVKKSAGKMKTRYNNVAPFLARAIPFISILIAVFYYSNRISDRLKLQFTNAINGNFIHREPGKPASFTAIREITKGSSDVYFLNFRSDFAHYYYGNYTPLGYFSPCASWIIKNDFAAFLQQLLDKHYYLVTNEIDFIKEFLPLLSYNRVIEKDGYVALSEEPVEPLLQQEKNEVFHLAIKDELATRGLIAKPVKLGRQFTIQCILNPSPLQAVDAVVFGNTQQNIGNRGFALQQSGSNTNKYIFGFGDKAQWVISPMFSLEPDQWNYLVITYNQKQLNVYINGILTVSSQLNAVLANSHVPLLIGNGTIAYDTPFKGYIREVKMCDYIIDESAISSNRELISHKL